jgi:hypothetical protein
VSTVLQGTAYETNERPRGRDSSLPSPEVEKDGQDFTREKGSGTMPGTQQ